MLGLLAGIFEEPVYISLVSRLVDLTSKLTIGDPTDRTVYSGTGGE